MTRLAATACWVLAALAIALASDDPLTRALVLAGAWALLARRHVRGRRLRPLAVGIGMLGAATMAVNGLLSHTGTGVLVSLPGWLPLVGGQVTVEGFAYGADVALGLVAAVSAAAVLSLVVEPSDLVDGLPSVLARTGAAVGSALNLVPAVASSFVAVRDAQRLRGWRPRGPRAMVDLAVPVLLGAIERSVQLAESMEARAFGSGARTRLPAAGSGPANLAGVVLSALALAAFAGARLAGAGAGWYPYPSLSVPSWGLAALGPPALLAAAGLLLPACPE